MTPLECIALILFSILLGVVLGVVIAFRLLGVQKQADNDLFVAMPSRKDEQGIFRDIVHPINEEMRKHITDEVIEAYKKEVTTQPASHEATIQKSFDKSI